MHRLRCTGLTWSKRGLRGHKRPKPRDGMPGSEECGVPLAYGIAARSTRHSHGSREGSLLPPSPRAVPCLRDHEVQQRNLHGNLLRVADKARARLVIIRV